jgi:hypothetical protein
VGHASPRIQVIARKWKYAAPSWRYFEALTRDLAGWLQPWEEERRPEVAVAIPMSRVVLRPWLHDDVSDVEILIDADGPGTTLTVLVHAPAELDSARRKEVRYRLGTLFGEGLRDYADGW